MDQELRLGFPKTWLDGEATGDPSFQSNCGNADHVQWANADPDISVVRQAKKEYARLRKS